LPSDDLEGQEYEWEFETPFGKVEFEVEPKASWERKEQQRREKAAREAARKERAEKRRLQRMGIPAGSEVVIVKRSNWLPVLTVFVIVLIAVGVAYWLFARPGEQDDEVPSEFRSDEATSPAQSGIVGRFKRALREGRRASREAQDEQMQRFKESTTP
jgi:hypothetical protein